jgi:hypothetical protein
VERLEALTTKHRLLNTEQSKMNVTDYTYLINKPNVSTELQRLALEKVLISIFSERKSFTIKRTLQPE